MKNFTITSTKLLFGRYDAAFYCLIPPFPTLIVMSEKYADNKALLAHEQNHLKQYKEQPWTYAFKMLFNKDFRYKMEVECYITQLLTYDSEGVDYEWKLKQYAQYLAKGYRLDVTPEEAYKELSRQLNKYPSTCSKRAT